MKKLFLDLQVKLISLIYGEQGQDLVEYALLVALVALAVTVGAHKDATEVSKLFTKVKKDLK